MGATVGKPGFGVAVAPRTQAEQRLALAEHALLQWTRSPGADSGIWDADASYTNRGLLAAVDEVLLLAAEDPFPLPAAAAARRRLDGAVGAAVSRMVEELLRVRVWNASRLRGAVDGLSRASSGLSRLVFPSAGGERASSAGSVGEVDASDGSRSRASSSVPHEVAALLDADVWDGLDLICPAGVSVLHEIALRILRAGRAEELSRAFSNAPCDVLDSFLSILRVECSQRTTEAVIKRWTTVTKIIGKAIAAMRRQLCAQNPGAFDGFRDEYLLAIAENRILILLDFADGFTGITSHEKLVYMLGMYEALTDAAPGLLFLFSGARKELISERTQGILTKLADAVKVMVSGVLAKIQGDDCLFPHTPTAAGGVHPLARDAMTCVELLARHRTTLDLILAGGERGSLAGVVSGLIAGLERNLQGRLAQACADAGGSRHLFLANNVGFVLSRVADADGVASLLGDAWAARRRSRLEQHVASYAASSWGPVVSLLYTPATASGRGRPAKVLADFDAAFGRSRDSEACREVPDPVLRAVLRNAVSEMLVPAYCAFLRKQPRIWKSARYTADDLAESLSQLFEGEAADGTKI